MNTKTTKLNVNGQFGPETISQLQRYFGVTADEMRESLEMTSEAFTNVYANGKKVWEYRPEEPHIPTMDEIWTKQQEEMEGWDEF